MAEPADTVTLEVNGRAYAGWTELRVRLGMESCAGEFHLQVSERWYGTQVAQAISAGDRCVLAVGGEPVITGFVDALRLAIDATAHSVEVAGRDAAADLVDCSAISAPGQWRNVRVEYLAQQLAQPFGVPVRAQVDTGRPLASFALQEGETAFEAIERAARYRALLVMSDGLGGLLITRAGVQRATTALVLGSNMLGARVGLDLRDRYSLYVLKGQAPGTDYFNAKAAAQIMVKASDPGIGRYRPLLVTCDAPDIAATLQQRALWEANVRAARSFEAEVLVQGWRHAGGLWRPNTLVQVQAETLRLNGELLVSSVEYGLDDRGTVTALRLTRPDAFNGLALREPAVAGPDQFWDKETAK